MWKGIHFTPSVFGERESESPPSRGIGFKLDNNSFPGSSGSTYDISNDKY